MKIKPESITFIITGNWNKYILNDKWVRENIFNNKSINIEFSFNPDIPFRYDNKKIRITPSEKRITFYALTASLETLDDIESKVKILIEKLNETPVNAFGMNVVYEEEKPNENFLKTFDFSDNLKTKYNILGREIHRAVQYKDKTVLNLILKLNDHSVLELFFNYHTEIKSTKELLNYLSNKPNFFNEVFDHSKTLLNEIYSVDLNGEGENHDN